MINDKSDPFFGIRWELSCLSQKSVVHFTKQSFLVWRNGVNHVAGSNFFLSSDLDLESNLPVLLYNGVYSFFSGEGGGGGGAVVAT